MPKEMPPGSGPELLDQLKEELRNIAGEVPKVFLRALGDREYSAQELNRMQEYLMECPPEADRFVNILSQPNAMEFLPTHKLIADEMGNIVLKFHNEASDSERPAMLARINILAIRAGALAGKLEGEGSFGQKSWITFLREIGNCADDMGVIVPSWWRFAGVKAEPVLEPGPEALALDSLMREAFPIGAESGGPTKEEMEAGRAALEKEFANLRRELEEFFKIKDPQNFKDILLGVL